MNSQSIQFLKIIVIICMSIWTIIASLISYLYVSRKIIFLKLNKYLLILWWILLIMGVMAYSLHTFNYKPDPNRMLDMNTDEAIIFYAIFPLTAPFLWAYIVYMVFLPVKLIINIKKVKTHIIYFGIILISTLLLKELVSIIVNNLIKNNSITDSLIILFNGILIIVENILSMVTIKILLNKVRGNYT